MTGPLAGGRFGDVCNAHAGAGAGVWADEEAGAPSLRRAVAVARGVPLMATGVQSGAALEGLLRDDGPRAGPLSTAHGALDCRGPVLVRAVLTGPLGADLCHRRAAAAEELSARLVLSPGDRTGKRNALLPRVYTPPCFQPQQQLRVSSLPSRNPVPKSSFCYLVESCISTAFGLRVDRSTHIHTGYQPPWP